MARKCVWLVCKLSSSLFVLALLVLANNSIAGSNPPPPPPPCEDNTLVNSSASGTYEGTATVRFSNGSNLRYTLNGSTPTSGSPAYSSPLTLTANTTVKVRSIVTTSNCNHIGCSYKTHAGKIAVANINVRPYTPTINSSAEPIIDSGDITITSQTSGTQIYYTLDGSTPTSSSTLYTGPFPIQEASTVKAIAVKSGMVDSSVGSAFFDVDYSQAVATPQFSPNGGAHTDAVSVSITSATSGATIYYTTDGTIPDENSPVYQTQLLIQQDTILKAIASKDFYENSVLASVDFVFLNPNGGYDGGNQNPGGNNGINEFFSNYEILTGNYNNDALDDIWLKKIGESYTFILLGGITVPILLPADHLVLVQTSAGVFELVHDPDRSALDAGTWLTRNSQELEFVYGDFDGDGNIDALLVSYLAEFPSMVFLAGANNSGLILSQIISNQEFTDPLSLAEADVEITDVNQDGRDDVVLVSNSGSNSGSTIYTLTSGSGGVLSELNNDPTAPPTVPPPINIASAKLASSLVRAIPGEFGVGSTGAAEYSIPIEIPPGTAGVQPDLSIGYSSQGSNGLLGVGWSLQGLSVISRCGATLSKDGFISGVGFNSKDRFCLDGQALIAISGTYGADGTEYRTELDGFARIKSYGVAGNGPSYFKVWTKSGDIMEYGATLDSQLNPPTASGAASSDALSWKLNKVLDSVGNYIEFDYYENASTGESYPTNITYTKNDNQALAGTNQIVFGYEDRADKYKSYVAGRKTESTKRLSNISIQTIAGQVIGEHKINYQSSTETNRSMVVSIERCNATNDCVNATTFDHTDSPQGWTSVSGFRPPVGTSVVYDNRVFDQGTRLTDLNGDGRVDMIRAFRNRDTYHLNAYYNTGSGWVTAPSAHRPPTTISYRHDYYVDHGGRMVDLNGDGLQDMIKSTWWECCNNDHRAAWINTGSGWVSHSGYRPPSGMYITRAVAEDHWDEAGLRFVDVNGDGLQDMVKSISGGTNLRRTYLNTGNGWQLSNAYSLPAPYYIAIKDGNSYYENGVRFIDLNGDNLVDVVWSRYHDISHVSTRRALLNTGSGWVEAPARFRPPYDISRFHDNPNDGGVRIVDLNGDGLQDMVRGMVGHNNRHASINTGDGWITSSEYTIPFYITIPIEEDRYDDYGVRFADVNGDGLQDILQSIDYHSATDHRSAYLNTGSGWVYSSAYRPSQYFSRQMSDGKYYDNNVLIADFDGDGSQDMVWSNGSSRLAHVNKMPRPDLVTDITNGLDVNISIEHKPITDDSVYPNANALGQVYQEVKVQPGESLPLCLSDRLSAACPILSTRFPLYVVSRSQTDNGVGSQNALNYEYEKAMLHMHGRGFLGFGMRKVMDEVAGTTVYTSFQQAFPYTGLVSMSETVWGNRRISLETNHSTHMVTATKSVNQAVAPYTANDPVFFYTDQGISQSYDIDTGNLLTTVTTTNNNYDQYGNPMTIIVDTVDEGIGSYKTTTTNFYNNVVDSEKWHLARLYRSEVVKEDNGAQSTPRTSEFAYYADSGLIHTETIEPDTTDMWLRKTYQYDGFGNKTSILTEGYNITARATTTSYDAQGRFPEWSENALLHREYYEHNDLWGNRTKLTGPNGLITTWEFDDFGRVYIETRADGTWTQSSYQYCSGSNVCPTMENGVEPSYVSTVRTIGAPVTKTYYDKVNRAILTETPNFNGVPIFVQTEFDTRAREKRTSLPYTDNPYYWNTNMYDTLDRLTEEFSPSTGRTTYQYMGFEIMITNELDQASMEKKNSMDQTLWTKDAQGNYVYFTYDPAGNIKTVSDGVNITTNTYDIRGFKISQDDPDMGLWKYEYNVLGELIKQWDAKTPHGGDPTVSMTYDVLGRMLTRTEVVGSATGTTVWEYDGPNGIGKFYSVLGHDGYVKVQDYDTYSRPSVLYEAFDTGDFTTSSVTYDVYGRVKQTSYPSENGYEFVTENTYNAFGYLETVQDLAATVTYWQALAADEFGNVTIAVLGNGQLDIKDYENNSGRLFYSSVGLGNIQNMRYSYDALGNVMSREDVRASLYESFEYDVLNRLEVATVSGIAAKTYTYNHLGNIDNKSDVGSYIYGVEDSSCSVHGSRNAGPHAVTSVAGANYCYDDNGNMVSGDGRTIEWSSFNKPTRIAKQGNYNEFDYAPDRNRYRQRAFQDNVLTTTTYMAGGLSERVIKNNNKQYKHFIRAGGQVIAIYTATGNSTGNTQYLHRDLLGSVDVITNSLGIVIERLSFDPFGQRRQSTDWDDGIITLVTNNTRGFTGHEHLDATGVIHMNGRVYDAKLGRFLSADPFVQQPKDLQSLNRYTYVKNNPLTYTDPSGFFFKKLKKLVKKAVRAVKSALKNPYVRMALGLAAGIGVGALINQAVIAANSAVVLASAGPVAVAGVGISATTGAVLAGAAGGFVGGLVASGGDIKSAALLGVTGGASGFIGASRAFGTVGKITARRIVAHGVVGGARSAAQSGSFKSGFISSAFTKSFSNVIENITDKNVFAGGIAAAVVGGTASKLTGGKFQNAALTTGFQYLFNEATKKRFLSGKDQLKEELKDRPAAVIGENMLRVDAYAAEIGAETFTPSRWFNENEMDLLVEENIQWVVDKMDQGYVIIDVGPDPSNEFYPEPTSGYYIGELTHIAIRQYEHYYPIWGTPSLMEKGGLRRLINRR